MHRPDAATKGQVKHVFGGVIEGNWRMIDSVEGLLADT